MNFAQYLLESLDVEKLKNLEHAEDHIIHGGHDGVRHASETLSDVASFLQGKPRKSFNQQTKITTKYDGEPSIVFGINPENKKFFVASQAAFGKNPKINYSERDINDNHGSSPAIAAKLKIALQELPKIMPTSGGVFRGSMMYTKDDLEKNKDGSYSFTPNTITYTTNSPGQTRSAEVSNLGIVVDSRYSGKTLIDSKINFDVDQNAFKNNPDVHMISPEIEPAQIAPIEKKQFEDQIEQATNLYSKMPDDIFNVVDGHDGNIKTYINACVKDGSTPDGKGYLKFIQSRTKGESNKTGLPASQQKKKDQSDTLITHVKNHMDQLNNIFKLHQLLQKAKDTLVSVLSRTKTGFKTTMGGNPIKPNSFVATRGGRPTNLVNRKEFGAANFSGGTFQKASKEEQVVAKETGPQNPIVTSYGRMNPPSYAGHSAIVNKVDDLAKEHKAKKVIALSHFQDPEKNPLTPEQKLKHIKRMFPKANIEIADEKSKTIIDHVKKLAKEGHDHLVMVVGSDRVEEIKKLLDKHNDKDYSFKKIDVVSTGQRDVESQDNKMQHHAITGKYGEFKKGMHPDVSDVDAKEMYHEVRNGMDITINDKTTGISLARYAKRKDPIGVKARQETARRKMVNEEQMSTGDIRGLGYVSGNPAGFLDAWTALNASDADTRDQIMNQTKKDMHDNLHNTIQQRQADQKNLFVKNLLQTIKDRNI